jgi:hypothetical protein
VKTSTTKMALAGVVLMVLHYHSLSEQYIM